MIRIVALLLLISLPAHAFDLLTPAEQGGLLIGRVDTASKLFYNGKRIRTTNDGRFMIGLDRDAPKRIVLSEKKASLLTIDHPVYVKQRKWDIQHINGIAPEKINPPETEMPRIYQEIELIKQARQYSTSLYFPMCFKRPITRSTRDSGVFGSQRIYNGEAKNYHSGHDYAAPQGTDVKAAAKGKVVLAYDEMYFNGKMVMIDHGFGIFSTYLHMSRLMVKSGDTVKQGESIGKVGSTGRSTGPHLHFGIEWYGVKLDPEAVIKNSRCGS